MLLLHGFPTSSLDFHRVIDRLAAEHRVIVHDHVGFGCSSKPEDDSYSLMEQADRAIGLWRRLGVTAGHVLAHDYGTSVATELAARAARDLLPIQVGAWTLSNGSVLLELARLRPLQRLLRRPRVGPLIARGMRGARAKRALRRLWARPERAEAADLDAMWQALRLEDGHLRVPRLLGYLEERVRFRGRWLDALRRLSAPLLLLWGRRDPVAVPAIAERLHAEVAGSDLVWLEEAGHFPMLETPADWADSVLAFDARAAA